MKIVLSRKPGIPKNLKFPIGFEIVNEKFKNINDQKSLNLNFSNEIGNGIGLFVPYSFGSLTKLKNSSKELLEFRQILTVNFSIREQIWNFKIFPNEIDQNIKIKKFISENGLELCKIWIETKRNQTWFEGQRFLQIGINENLTKYCVLETLNEFIIEKRIENKNYG